MRALPTHLPKPRAEHLAVLASVKYDLLIVGGGITGAATTRDATMRGLKVACVEKTDFAYGTSSRSSKLVHGGLRYLEQMKLKLVFEGTQERATVQGNAPHLVKPLAFVMPSFVGDRHGPRKIGIGLWLYDQLAGRRRYGRHQRFDREAFRALEPTVRDEGLVGGALYYDCMTDDARLVIETVIDAERGGATILNYCRYLAPIRDGEGRIVGARVEDGLTGTQYEVQCRVLVHCAGPWTDEVLAQGEPGKAPMIRTTKGVHLCIPAARLPVRHAVVMTARRDRRVIFAIPWGRVTLVGTTDTDYTGSPDAVAATRDDVDYLKETLAHTFPSHPIGDEDVIATYAGLRPLVRDDANSPYDTSREHTVLTSPDGRVTISGGKLTTHRRMAHDVVVAAMELLGMPKRQQPKCPTAKAALPGAQGFDLAQDVAPAVAHLVARGAPDDVAEWLVNRYGARWSEMDGALSERLVPGLPFTVAEADHAMVFEHARTLEDVLIRRLPVYYEAPEQGLECVDHLAARMASQLGWDAAQSAAHIQRYRDTVARSRAWRT